MNGMGIYFGLATVQKPHGALVQRDVHQGADALGGGVDLGDLLVAGGGGGAHGVCVACRAQDAINLRAACAHSMRAGG